ncbi:hypothetical protein [Paenibacillus sp. 2TAB19]|uniref:hypothetical protein n=1 Tax=Paenibacillus sp. 2TAB19 TaxID=3233003 RepID=UPI003F9AB0A1
MDERLVTCTSIGVYGHAITRGNVYLVVTEDEDKYRVIGNHNKRVWISKDYFTEGEVEVPVLRHWKFDDDLDDFDLIEVTIIFSNGERRWCIITTPQRLVRHFEKPNLEPPGFNIRHLIIVKSVSKEDVDLTLRHLDEQGELEKATISLNPL